MSHWEKTLKMPLIKFLTSTAVASIIAQYLMLMVSRLLLGCWHTCSENSHGDAMVQVLLACWWMKKQKHGEQGDNTQRHQAMGSRARTAVDCSSKPSPLITVLMSSSPTGPALYRNALFIFKTRALWPRSCVNKVRGCRWRERGRWRGSSFSWSMAAGIQAMELSEFPWALPPHVALIFNLVVCYG